MENVMRMFFWQFLIISLLVIEKFNRWTNIKELKEHYSQVKHKVQVDWNMNYYILMKLLKGNFLHPASSRGSPPRG